MTRIGGIGETLYRPLEIEEGQDARVQQVAKESLEDSDCITCFLPTCFCTGLITVVSLIVYWSVMAISHQHDSSSSSS